VATWVLTGSLENLRINVERGFDVIGFKERRRKQAADFKPGDEIVFYVTGVQAFGGGLGVLGAVDLTHTAARDKPGHPKPAELPTDQSFDTLALKHNYSPKSTVFRLLPGNLQRLLTNVVRPFHSNATV
jgi:hypothetical protein